MCKELQCLDVDVKEIGYIEPGHGVKGRMIWLRTLEDLNEIYVAHSSRHEVILWCYMKQDESVVPQQVRRVGGNALLI